MVETVIASRKAVGRKLIRNIEQFGRLDSGQEETAARPYNALSPAQYRFTGANYLRILAYPHTDPRWYKEADLVQAGYTLRKNAVPVELEAWTNLGEGIQKATARLERYYNAKDVYGLPSCEKVPTDRAENLEHMVELLQCAEEKRKNLAFFYPTGKENLFHRFKAAVQTALAKEPEQNEAVKKLVPSLTAYLAFKTVNLSYDYEKNPLFSEKQLDILHREKGPDVLFQAMGKASRLFNELQEKQLQFISEKGTGEALDCFPDLRVTLYYTELNHFCDSQGRTYKPGAYRGEEAYRLLSDLNAVDKERWEKQLGQSENRGRTKLSIEYKNCALHEAIVNLGELEFGNSTSVSQALGVRMPADARRQMANRDRLHLQLYRYDRTEEENRRAVTDKVEFLLNFVNACKEASQEFALEEELYLSKHPQIQEMNRERAGAYLYYTKGHPENLPAQAIQWHKPEDFPQAKLKTNNSLWQQETSFANFSMTGTIVECAVPLDIKKHESYWPVVTQEEQNSLQALKNLKIAYFDDSQKIQAQETQTTSLAQGEAAMRLFVSCKLEDAELANPQFHKLAQGENVKLEFFYRDKPFWAIQYPKGSGELNRSVPVGFPHATGQAMDKELQTAVRTWAKYNNQNKHDACRILYTKSWMPTSKVKKQRILPVALAKDEKLVKQTVMSR